MTAFIHVVMLVAALAAPFQRGAAPAQPTREDRTVYLDEQQTFTPGYPIGDIALGNPEVADFKVQPGRRELLLFGKGLGKTTLTIWDQQGVKRHEILLAVSDRKVAETESELRDMLKDFPGLQVRTLAGSLAITGTVTTESDRDVIEKIASAAGAQNLVRFNPPAPSRGVPTNPMPQPGNAPRPGATPTPAGTAAPQPAPGGAPASPVDPGGAAGASALVSVEYELDILEASVQFASGSYATGVEPSGRSLFRRTIRVAVGNEGEVFVPAESISKAAANANRNQQNQQRNQTPARGAAAATPPQPVGLRLRLRPDAPEDNGSFNSYLLIETNVPAGQVSDTSIMRRARWQFAAQSGEPIGIAGAELLALADTTRGPSAVSRASGTASFWASLPGVSSIKGSSYAGSIPYYDPQTKTQLLLIVHPKLIQGK